MNITLARKTIESLLQIGVSEFCICAGARNAPFVVSLEASENLKIHRFFEERSAAFFALGRIQRDGKPVAVITTSGTAVAEMLSAAVEATYTNLPLVLVSADRPQNYRGMGAPQSIEQVGIFSSYVETCLDVTEPQHLHAIQNWSQEKPLHVNVCFAEPLLDEAPIKISYAAAGPRNLRRKIDGMSPGKISLKNPMIIIGALKEQDRPSVLNFLLKLNCPVYAEATSGLRGEPQLQSLLLKSGERSVQQAFQKNWCESVLRIGGVPTLRFWRDLEDKFVKTPVTSFSENQFTGLSRKVSHHNGFMALENVQANTEFTKNIMEEDRLRFEKLETLFKAWPKSEPGIFWQLAKTLEGKSVYLGNSMPIREWDLCATVNLKFARVGANRGANGIDGQVSSFLGWSHPDFENWAILGDLTALYDLSALWMSDSADSKSLRIVVINNGGGQIFKNIFKDEKFLNRHKIQFQKWAEMFHWSYQTWEKVPTQLSPLFEREVIEVFPNELDTDSFWRAYQNL